MINNHHKQWLSPFTAITFLAVSVSGVFLLFHFKLAGMYQIHQWGGLLFIAAGVLHVVFNWRAFASYFNGKKAIAGAVAAVVGIGLMVAVIPHNGHGGKNFGREIGSHHSIYGDAQIRR